MPRQTIVKNSFNTGEISPRARGRTDFQKFPFSVKTLENFLVNQLGGIQMCPGTKYIAATKNATERSRLIQFQFNSAQAYALEMGNMYMRFYVDKGQLKVPAGNVVDDNTILLADFNNVVQTNNCNTSPYTCETGQVFSFFGTGASGTACIIADDKFEGTSTVPFGSANVDTDIFGTNKFGYITTPHQDEFDFGTDDFTVDFWIQHFNGDAQLDNDEERTYISRNETDTSFVIKRDNDGDLKVILNGTTHNFGNWNPTNQQWYHLAIDRDGTNLRAYVDGTQFGTTKTSSDNISNGSGIQIGRENDTWVTQWPTFRLDELRISDVARYSGVAFTAPTAKYGGANEWQTSTSYVVGDYVNESDTIYICEEDHTSGTFATDLAAGKWSAQEQFEVVTPWSIGDLPQVQYSQDADVMYFYHHDYPTQKLTRTSATSFTLEQVDFVRGPFLDDNITVTTITPSAATGAGITLTASTDTFESGHVGSFWKINDAVVKITAFTSATVVTGDVQAEPDGTAGNIGGTSAYTAWAEGAFSDVRGYPGSGTFHDQRHILGGTNHQPQHVFATVVGAFENMKVDANDDSAAFVFKLVAQEQNQIRWMNSDTNSLQIGTSGGTMSVRASTEGIAINASNVTAVQASSYGAARQTPNRISSFLYYVHKVLHRMYELTFDLLKGRDVSADMNKIHDHILRDGDGAYEAAYQQSPMDRIWVVRNDGQLAIMTRNPNEDVTGWSRRIGGADSMGNGLFESITVLRQDGQDDCIYVIVRRCIDGSDKRYVEYFSPEDFENECNAVLLDSALTLDNPIRIADATKADPVVITTVENHNLSNGDMVRIEDVLGMTDLNGNEYKVANKTDNTFELNDSSDNTIDGTGYSTHRSNTGTVRKKVTAVSGLNHLEGETVSAQIDGELPSTETYTVTSGAITLSDAGAVIHVGLPYTPLVRLLKQGGVTEKGTGHTKKQRFYGVEARVDQTKQFQAGQLTTTTVDVPMPSTGLYTGDVNLPVNNWWDNDVEFVIKQTKPLPIHILALFIKMDVDED